MSANGRADANETRLEVQRQAAVGVTFTEPQVALVKRTCLDRDATNDELSLFLHVAAKSGLDPLQRQIYAVRRQGRLVFQAGVDGLRARANRFQDFQGESSGAVCATDKACEIDPGAGTVRHVFDARFEPGSKERGPLVSAWALVYRAGKRPTLAIVYSREYPPTGPVASEKRALMLEKIACATALRHAYPDSFASVYAPEEFSRVDTHTPMLPATDAGGDAGAQSGHSPGEAGGELSSATDIALEAFHTAQDAAAVAAAVEAVQRGKKSKVFTSAQLLRLSTAWKEAEARVKRVPSGRELAAALLAAADSEP